MEGRIDFRKESRKINEERIKKEEGGGRILTTDRRGSRENTDKGSMRE
jgi:hypothetical protein